MQKNRRWIPVGLIIGSILVVATSVARADYREGIKFFKQRNYEEAARVFREEVEYAPNYSFGWYMLGVISLQQKKFTEAVPHFQKAIELDPNKFIFYQGQAKVHADQGDYQKAIEALEERQGLAESERDKKILNTTLGSYYVKIGNHAQAVQYLEKAKSNPPSISLLSKLGTSYYSLGDFDHAIENLRAANELQRENKNILFLLGNSYISKAQGTRNEPAKISAYNEAVMYSRQLVHLDSQNYQYQNLLARSLFGAKRFGDSLISFEKVLELNPKYCFAYTNVGKVYQAQNRLPEAEGFLKKGIQCDPMSSVTYQVLGSVLEKEKNFDASLKAFKDGEALKSSRISKEGVARLQAKITNRDLEMEQKRLDTAAARQYAEEQQAYEDYQKNLEKFYDKDKKNPEEGNKDEDNEGEEKEGDGE